MKGGRACLLLALLLLLAAMGCGSRDVGGGMAANPTVAPTAAGGTNPAPQLQAAPSPTVAAAPIATATTAATATARPPTTTLAATISRPTATATPTSAAEITPSLIQLADPLDEPEFYCVDVPGFWDSLRTDRPLQAHTCKPGADDELFIAHQPGTGQFLMPAYNLCMEAEGNRVYTRVCADHPAQFFSHRDD